MLRGPLGRHVGCGAQGGAAVKTPQSRLILITANKLLEGSRLLAHIITPQLASHHTREQLMARSHYQKRLFAQPQAHGVEYEKVRTI